MANLCDPSLEVSDPAPNILELFQAFNATFFGNKLQAVECRWSPRMTLCAGICVYQGGGYCSVRLSAPLLRLRPRADLVNTLLHEMIHAYLFVTDNYADHSAHGPNFLSHAKRINSSSGTNITVYHTFHDEVDVYRTHVWKCSGRCVEKPPYYGLVKRAMNRAPGPTDPWWAVHAAQCGGSYTKISGPEPSATGKASKKKKAADGSDDICKWLYRAGTSAGAPQSAASSSAKATLSAGSSSSSSSSSAHTSSSDYKKPRVLGGNPSTASASSIEQYFGHNAKKGGAAAAAAAGSSSVYVIDDEDGDADNDKASAGAGRSSTAASHSRSSSITAAAAAAPAAATALQQQQLLPQLPQLQ